ncbi:PspC domain-containing protein [Nocardioides piscis]|uniref:PspC domain-containing protein n=1 Tax=Nocardioides piscis TaxID=2714938 RepID=A0A6G7YFQ0_9ACTN|nr:PspC domain-containing protein [Nocardioides piscis]QIK75496.1 PspC domain-containing protein [Nocardioides piscis]
MTNPSPPPAVEPGPVDQPGHETRPPRNDILDLGRLRRSTDDRRIAGVAAGLARHLDIDPIIVRVTLVVLVFFGGSGLLLYGAAWLLVPEEGSPSQPLGLDDRNRNIGLIGVGVLAALAALGDFAGAFWFPWPLVIIGLLVVWFLRRSEKGPRPPGQWYAQTAHAQAAPASVPAQGPPPPYAPYDPTAYARPRNPRKQGPILFWFTLAMLATAIGTLSFIDVSGADVPAAAYPALGLALTGVMLAVGAFWGAPGA